jgi:hypothetical protein
MIVVFNSQPLLVLMPEEKNLYFGVKITLINMIELSILPLDAILKAYK